MSRGEEMSRRMKLVQEALYLADDIGVVFEDKNWMALTGPIEDGEAMVDKMKLLKAEIDRRVEASKGSAEGFIRLPDLKDFGL